jgi:putative membrane protein
MILRWLIASLHVLALPLGVAAIWARARELRVAQGPDDLHRVFVADNLWGLAAALWLGTGLLRLLGGLEKATAYYLHDRVFYAKMGLFLMVLLLEVWPMVTLIRWRIGVRRGTAIDITPAPTFARISQIQLGLLVLIVCAATALARGFFY